MRMDQPPGYSPGLVSRLSGVPKATVVNWLNGRVARPRRWQDVIRVADAMRLSREATDLLLAAACHPTLGELSGIVDGRDAELVSAWLRTSGSDEGPTFLPTAATPLLGRESERAALSDLLTDRDIRIVTLTGPGGVGKTRLAIEAARSVTGHFRDGVVFVGLAPLTDASLVPEFIEHALGLTGDRMGETSTAVSSRDQLVVVDNFEHVLVAVQVIADLIAGAPHLTFLVTSRAVLHIYGEHQVDVQPLPVPGEDERALEVVAANPAVQLFTQRARSVNAAFALSDANVSAISEICRRLDGLPLAIELAAARTVVLEPEHLLTRLASRLGLLTGGARDLPLRHQSLQATLDWSLEQLDDPARKLFANLSVFMSGFRLDGAEAVAAGWGTESVLSALMTLIDHSLVRRVTVGSQSRFVMLEIIRSYAASLLTDAESDAAHELALQHILMVASAVQIEAERERGTVMLRRASEEFDNIRALLRWSVEHNRPGLAAAVASSLLPLWLQNRLPTEGRRWFDIALREPEKLPPALRASTLYAAGAVALTERDLVTAEHHLRESLTICTDLGDEEGRARAFDGLAELAAHRGDFGRAAELRHSSLDVYRSLGDDRLIAITLGRLGTIAEQRRQPQQAVAFYRASAASFAADETTSSGADAMLRLASTQIQLGDFGPAQTTLKAAAPLWKRLDSSAGLARTLELWAAIAASLNRPLLAIRLSAASAVVRQTAGPVAPETAEHAAIVAGLRQLTGNEPFEAAWRKAASISTHEAIQLAHGSMFEFDVNSTQT